MILDFFFFRQSGTLTAILFRYLKTNNQLERDEWSLALTQTVAQLTGPSLSNSFSPEMLQPFTKAGLMTKV
jgi:hypothetical protein